MRRLHPAARAPGAPPSLPCSPSSSYAVVVIAASSSFLSVSALASPGSLHVCVRFDLFYGHLVGFSFPLSHSGLERREAAAVGIRLHLADVCASPLGPTVGVFAPIP